MIFQPHRFSRTAQLFDDFIQVLKKVDSLIMLDIYAASENPIKGIDSRTIVETLKQNGHKDVSYIKKHNDVIKLIDNAPRTDERVYNKDLKNIIKKIPKNTELAIDLWNKNYKESRLIAINIADPKTITEKTFNNWLNDF